MVFVGKVLPIGAYNLVKWLKANGLKVLDCPNYKVSIHGDFSANLIHFTNLPLQKLHFFDTNPDETPFSRSFYIPIHRPHN